MRIVAAQQNKIENVRLCIPMIQKTFFPVTSVLEKLRITNPRYTITKNTFEKTVMELIQIKRKIKIDVLLKEVYNE